ncbi:ABC transporter permease [Bacillus cereus]|uniref:ABC transporter permease subunit n=1 Tax=Bacillus arachidis TaxID=2819290 RepID=A0ABS3NT53_9BACI|nr:MULTISPECIES: ABC transporter permease subunit [Bacillus]PGY02633.1 ABC transporter permease [Bacillus cereus]MBO1624117.1 ABC transporter permease subunit [Bacillus arachidis]PFD99056.1 ABC transporter permease [Bacillus sp. AFS023182]WIY61281.1 ABC transporter permease subunit [Bacillus arachidis]SDZ19794.1 ABC-2 type transport system permease protein [Bacillus sp. 166amftsu]
MREFANLVLNESEKIYRKKRIFVVVLILAILIPLFVYAQYREVQTTQKRLGTSDWKVALQQQIVDSQNRLNNSRLPEEWRDWLKVRVEQQQYYLDHDINPTAPGAPTFVRAFIEQGITLFIPLLVMIVAIDIVSGERSEGTMKMLLTRPIRRFKILLSKYVTMLLFISLILLLVGIFSYALSGIVFGYAGWSLPILTGFGIDKETLNTNFVHLIPQWQYILMAYGLAWFVAIVVGTISFMVSVLIRNTPAGMGVMLAALIAGGILNSFATSWEGAKYIFSVNLSLTDYLSGKLPALQGLSMSFSLMNLTVWAVASLIISFVVFTKQDMIN